MPRPHALVLGTRNNHNSPAHYEQLAGLLVGPAGLSVTVRDDYPAQTEASLAGFDLLVLWAADARPPLPQAATEAVFATVRRGTPLLGIHGAAFTVGKVVGGPEAGGAAYQSPHLPVQEFTVHVEDPQHPVTAGVDDFRIEDEPYRLDVVGTDVRVLCTFDARAAVQYTSPPRPEEVVAAVRDWSLRQPKAPVVYVKRLGAGTVCLNTLGHSPGALATPGFRQLAVQAAHWLLEEGARARAAAGVA
jgi:type 1 glutamine amidotransferase